MQQVAWDDLRIFLAVTSTGTIRRAARALGVNASTVSRRLAALEEALTTRLFERHPSGLKLTSAGEEVKRFGDRLDDEMRELYRRVARHDQRLSGTVRVTSAEIVAPLVCQALRDFIEQNPSVSIDLTISDAMVSLERHEVDVAIRVADEPPEQLVGRRVGKSAVGIYASEGYLERRSYDLNAEGHRWIEWPRGLAHKPAFRWLDESFKERYAVLRANSASSVLQAVKAGLGVAPLACAQVVTHTELRLLARLPESCSTSVWLLTHRDLRHTARVRALLDHLAGPVLAKGLS